MSKAYDFFNIGDYDISENNKLMAYSYDTLSRRIYNIRIKDLLKNELLEETFKIQQVLLFLLMIIKLFFMVKKTLRL